MTTTVTAGTRYLTLDHWRGVACLFVLVNHSVWFRTGNAAERLLAAVADRLWIGVPVFFVISGYCISAAADSHLRRAGRPLSTYFLRRLRRIYPPYWAVLIATMAVVAVCDVAIPDAPLSRSGNFLRPWWYSLQQWLGNLTLTEIWRYHIWPGQKAMILGHAWTLCYEEQFYVVVGLLLWLVPGRFFLGTFGVTCGVGLAVLAAAWSGVAIDGFFFDGSWMQFWFGVILYYGLTYASTRGRAAIWLVFLGSAALSAHDPAKLIDQRNAEQFMFTASVFAAAAFFLHRFDRQLFQFGVLKPIQTCGVMCYSLYLVHLPVCKLLLAATVGMGMQLAPFASVSICVPASLAVGWWFHRTVERRFLNTAPVHPGVAAVAAIEAPPI